VFWTVGMGHFGPKTVGMSHGLARLPRTAVGPKDRYAASRTTGAPETSEEERIQESALR